MEATDTTTAFVDGSTPPMRVFIGFPAPLAKAFETETEVRRGGTIHA
jgi:hypothetical protein